ncbi:hypothetical protein [Bradyrhizobium sp. 23]|uniref:hypothetical protein n=1 Tax=Bradyrhizobium sp. 23 TaxID=2782667 RepID=UPI001FFB5AAC|nr:hypothetical protein [Bradyrhizobium sp. 23]
MNFQVTVLKTVVSYPDVFASMPELKRDMAILATSGLDWAARTKRMGARMPYLDVFSDESSRGVKGAFLWTFIWSFPGTLKLRNLSFPVQTRLTTS